MTQRIVFWTFPRTHLPDAGEVFALNLDRAGLVAQFPALAQAMNGANVISHSTVAPHADRIVVSFVVDDN